MLHNLSWKEFKITFYLSLPLILSEVLQSSTPFFGVLIIARLGQQALAASALVNLAWFTLMAFSFGMLNAVSILVSRLYGEQKQSQIKIVMSQVYIMVLLISAIILALFCLLPYLLVWTGQPNEVVQLGTLYIHALRWAIPTLILMIAFDQFLYGLHKTRLIFIISALQIPFEILAMFVLTFGWGVPALGIQGVGYGQALVFIMGVVGMITYLNLSPQFRIYRIARYITWCPYYFWMLLKVGLPIGLMYLIEVLAFFCLGVMIAHINSVALAANQITIQYLSIILTVTMAISQVVTVRVGYAIGQNTIQSVGSYVATGLALGLLITLVTQAVYWVIPYQLLAINVGYDRDAGALLAYFKQLIILAGFYQIVDCCRVIISGALRAFKDTSFLMISSLIAYFIIAIPTAYCFGFIFNWGSVGVWCGMIIGSVLGAIIVYTRLYNQLPQSG